MKINTNITLIGLFITSVGTLSAALTIKSGNIIGFDSTTAAVVDNAGRALTTGTVDPTLSDGSVFVGTFGALTDGQIQVLGSGASIDAAFTDLGSISISNGTWETIINFAGDTTGVGGTPIFTVVTNNSDIQNASQFFIYRHSDVNTDGRFKQAPDNNDPATVDPAKLGGVVVGGYGNVTHNFGAGELNAFNLVTVPEPSSTALLGLGGVALLLRRRR